MFRKYIAVCIILLAFMTQVTAQVFNVPEKSKKHFAAMYKHATDVDWKNKVTDYDCHFKLNGIDCRANYNLDGTWNYTEKFIPASQVPAEVTEAFSKGAYRDWEHEPVVFVENNKKQKLYRYEVKKGIKKSYIFFDKKGKLIKENMSI